MTLDKPEMRGTVTFTPERKPLFDFGEIIKELKTRIHELEAYKKDVENACKMAMDEKCSADQKHCTCVPLLRQKVKELEDWKRKWAETFGMIMAEKCPEDEIHCGCVPFLRVKVKELEEKNEKLRDIASDAYDWAVLHGIEMRSGIWHRLKQELKP